MDAILKFIVLFMPGLFASAINGTFGSGRRNPVLNYVHVTIIFGIISYFALAQIYSWVGREMFVPIFLFNQEALDLKNHFFSTRLWLEILHAGIITLFLLGIWLLVDKYRLIATGLKAIRVTDQIGEDDLLTVLLNKLKREKTLVKISDLTNEISYIGRIESFSEFGDFREIVLINSEVFTFDQKLRSKEDRCYIALRKENFWIDFPKIKRSNENG